MYLYKNNFLKFFSIIYLFSCSDISNIKLTKSNSNSINITNSNSLNENSISNKNYYQEIINSNSIKSISDLQTETNDKTIKKNGCTEKENIEIKINKDNDTNTNNSIKSISNLKTKPNDKTIIKNENIEIKINKDKSDVYKNLSKKSKLKLVCQLIKEDIKTKFLNKVKSYKKLSKESKAKLTKTLLKDLGKGLWKTFNFFIPLESTVKGAIKAVKGINYYRKNPKEIYPDFKKQCKKLKKYAKEHPKMFIFKTILGLIVIAFIAYTLGTGIKALIISKKLAAATAKVASSSDSWRSTFAKHFYNKVNSEGVLYIFNKKGGHYALYKLGEAVVAMEKLKHASYGANLSAKIASISSSIGLTATRQFNKLGEKVAKTDRNLKKKMNLIE